MEPPATSPPATGPRWHDSSSWLDDLAIVTWAVEPERLAQHLPAGWEPLGWKRSGTDVALVSMVSFRDRDFRFNFWPWTRLRCGQINYRAYVRHGDQTGVWFFGTSLDSRLVSVPKTLWKMPWHLDRIDVSSTWRGDRLDGMQVRARGAWGDADAELVAEGGPVGSPPMVGLTLGEDLSQVLVDPFVGWYGRTTGGVGSYSVAHAPMRMAPCRVLSARSAVFERLGLIEPNDHPIDARATRQIRFQIHTPPRRLRQA